MHFLTTALVASVAAAGLIQRRDASILVNDITSIDSALKKVNATANAFPGGKGSALQALDVQEATTALKHKLETAASDAQASAVLNQADSTTVAQAVLALEPDVFSVLDNLVALKPTFDKPIFGTTGASVVVSIDLNDLQNVTGVYASALTGKLDASFQQAAPIIVKQINDHFASAIAAYT